MTFTEQLTMTVVDKALIGILLLTAGFALNRTLERTKHEFGLASKSHEFAMKSSIDFKEKQIAEFYAPLYALLKQIRPLDDLWNQRKLGRADRAVVAAIRKANDRIVEIILSKSHLMEGEAIAEYIPRFLTHVAIWHAYLDDPAADWSSYERLPEAHYDAAFEDEVFSTTATLRKQLVDLHARYTASRR